MYPPTMATQNFRYGLPQMAQSGLEAPLKQATLGVESSTPPESDSKFFPSQSNDLTPTEVSNTVEGSTLLSKIDEITAQAKELTFAETDLPKQEA